MTGLTPRARYARPLDYVLLTAMAIAAALGVAALFGLGVHTFAAGIRISSRSLFRPTVVVVVVALIWLYRAEDREAAIRTARDATTRRASAIALLLSILVFAIAL